MLQKRCVKDDKILWFLHGIISHFGTIFRTYPDEIRFALHHHASHWAQQGKKNAHNWNNGFWASCSERKWKRGLL
jgi:hypothetical protein